jgi:8-oxo-dGTP pyrophosphatase MutT (NUDIX family)
VVVAWYLPPQHLQSGTCQPVIRAGNNRVDFGPAPPSCPLYTMPMDARNVAVGFLYHVASGKVLLHLRDADKPPNAGKWACFGGRCEPADGGDLLATWCRELREELGVTLDPARVVSLRYGAYDDGRRWHDFYCEWPSLDEEFVLTEGQCYAWFTLDEALSLPDLADYAREDLGLMRARVVRGH